MKPTNPLTYVDALLKGAIQAHLGTIPEWESVTVHTGESDGERTVPGVICYAAQATTPQGLPLFIRNYDVQATVMIESKADAQPDDETLVAGLVKHRDLVMDVMNCLRNVSAFKATVAGDGHKLYEMWPVSQQPDLQDENRSFRTSIDVSISLVLDLPPGG